MMKKIRVLCVDDSALMRGLMTQIINAQPDMTVVATAADPLMARERIKQHNPDVLTLDVEMPHMDGLDFLERLMRLRPMPVIMVSSLTERHSDITLRALELGAVDFVTKPRTEVHSGLLDYSQIIAAKIRAAAQVSGARLGALSSAASVRPSLPTVQAPAARQNAGAPAEEQALCPTFAFSPQTLIALGASTGGPEALRHVLQALPAHCPPILITKHMPAGFTRSFVQRLDKLCALHIHEAQDGEPVLPGHVYLAPGSIAHMVVARTGSSAQLGNAPARSTYCIRLDASEPVNRHRPSVDRLLQSVAQAAGRHAIGLVLTGMGKDGAQGLLAMRQAGAMTAAQDEASSVVWGMPREAVHIGAADTVLPLAQVSGWLLEQAGKHRPGNRQTNRQLLSEPKPRAHIHA